MQDVAASTHASGLSEPCLIGDSRGSALRDICKKQRHLLDNPLKADLGRQHVHGGPYHPISVFHGRDATKDVGTDYLFARQLRQATSHASRNSAAASSSHSGAPEPSIALACRPARSCNDDPSNSTRPVDCLDGRDATIAGTSVHPSLELQLRDSLDGTSSVADTRKRVASVSLECTSRRGKRASTCLRTPLVPSLPEPRQFPSFCELSQPRPKCINGNFGCPRVGWIIRDYCEACHG